jgi:diguanylate cyclase (GGDEF)-like protein
VSESTAAPARTAPVLALAALLAAGAAALHLLFLAGRSTWGGSDHLPWLALVALFAVADIAVVHVMIGREARTFGFAEVPFVIGLFLVAPSGVVAARVLGGAVALLWHRRQTTVKVVFNAAQWWLGGAAAATVWVLLMEGGSPYGVRGFAAALAATAVVELTSSASVTAVIALRGGGVHIDSGTTLVTGFAVAGANACFGLIALVVVHTDWRGLWIVGVLAAFLVFAHRAHLALLQRHDAMERLHGFTRRIGGGDLHLDVVVTEVLTGVRELLEVAVVRLDLHASDHDEPQAWIGDETGVRSCAPERRSVETAGDRVPRRGSYVESLTVLLHGEAGPVGAITVSGRLGDVGGLGQSDLRLLEALVGHAAIGLHNGRLADRLRDQVSENAHQAMHDSLTSLPNRLMFDRTAAASLATTEQCAVLLLDLDRFKEINDTLGHAAGDAVLQEVGRRLSAIVAADACVARLGGDEFAVVMVDADLRDATRLAEQIRSSLITPLDIVGVTLTVDASVGIALSPEHGSDIATLLRRADVAMYAAKDTHGGVAVYAPDRDHNSAARLALVADLRAAIANGELVLAYQPKTQTVGKDVHGVEALVRWQHPVRGMIPPDDFIGIAEQTGLIAPLTEWVLRSALGQCRQWLEQGLDLGVAVNISPRTLHDPAFSQLLTGLLAESRVPASRLTLEITEGALMADPERAIDVLWELRRAGVRLSVDDLGVGHSSLSYLKRLPVHEIKIDKSFVTGMVDDGDDEAIVTAVIAMVHRLRMTVVAEGVEDERTLTRLAELGADIAQGYWMSRPIPAADIPAWLGSWTSGAAPVVVPMQRTARFAH